MGMNVHLNNADHGRIAYIKDNIPKLLPPKTVDLFAHNDKGEVLWFASPPLDVITVPKPHHSQEYLARKLKSRMHPYQHSSQQQQQHQHQQHDQHQQQQFVESRQAVSMLSPEETLPVVLQGLEALKDQLSRDTQIIESR